MTNKPCLSNGINVSVGNCRTLKQGTAMLSVAGRAEHLFKLPEEVGGRSDRGQCAEMERQMGK